MGTITAHKPVDADRSEIFSWAMYDWANSAFSTIIVTTLLGPYLSSLAQKTNGVALGSMRFEPDAFFPACVSLSVILQVFLLPLLGTIADSSPLKKRLLVSFASFGATATILLFFVQENMPMLGTQGAVLLGGLLFILANLSFGAAVVLYNAFLPDIAAPKDRDNVSSFGWAIGYLGGGLALAIALALFTLMADKGLAVRISLALAGIWWLGFTLLFPARKLRQRPPQKQLPPGENYLSYGVKQIVRTLRTMYREYPETLKYLIAYLIYNDGIQTVIVVATLFASTELHVESSTLIILILMIQFIAFFGALLFGRMAEMMGAKKAIIISLVIWALIVIYAYAAMHQTWQLFAAGVFIAIVLGGSQALSRSLFSQMIPKESESEYFGFYEISERGTSWVGTAVFALAVQLTGSTRSAMLAVILFFVVGLALLIPVRVRKAMIDSGNDPAGVVI